MNVSIVDLVIRDLREDPSTLLFQELEVAVPVVEQLLMLHETDLAAKAVYACENTADDILYRVQQTADAPDYTKLMVAIARLDEWMDEGWKEADGMEVGDFAKNANRAEIIAIMNDEKLRKRFADPACPLCGCIEADPYWSHKVRWYIAKQNYRRAWDELKKAQRGICAHPLTSRERAQAARSGELEDREPRYLKACEHTVKILAKELFTAMDGKESRWETPLYLLERHFRDLANQSRRNKIAARMADK